MHCGMCHTPTNWFGAQKQNAKFSGGLIPIQQWFVPPLHSDKKIGIGKCSTEELATLLKTGISRYKSVYGPMSEVVQNSTQYLTKSDLYAISNYLQKQPQIKKIKTNSISNRLLILNGKKTL